MANIEHSSLTTGELHEPKNISAANSGEVYVADGAGSGVWTPLSEQLSGFITDISTAETKYIAIPYSGNLIKVTTVLEGAISGSDATITVKDNAGNTMATLTVANSGSAAGDVDNTTTITNSDVTDNDFITIETDGASTGSVRLNYVVTLERDS